MADRRYAGKLYRRGPFDFEEEAAFASKVMALAIQKEEEVPSTAEIRAMMPDLSEGRERRKTLREVQWKAFEQ